MIGRTLVQAAVCRLQLIRGSVRELNVNNINKMLILWSVFTYTLSMETTTNEQSFSEWIRTNRKKRGWSQVLCANKARLHPQRWNHLEKQSGRPHMQTVELIARVLEVPLQEALRAAGYECAVPTGILLADKLIDEIVGNLKLMDNRDVSEIADFVEFKLRKNVEQTC